MHLLSETEINSMIQNGDFSTAIRNAAEKVVVVLTQDWCPQWTDMASWLDEFSDQASIWYLEYNKHPKFPIIMDYKEKNFNNYEVPYVRYYYKWQLISETNWLPKRTFAAMLTRTQAFKI